MSIDQIETIWKASYAAHTTLKQCCQVLIPRKPMRLIQMIDYMRYYSSVCPYPNKANGQYAYNWFEKYFKQWEAYYPCEGLVAHTLPRLDELKEYPVEDILNYIQDELEYLIDDYHRLTDDEQVEKYQAFVHIGYCKHGLCWLEKYYPKKCKMLEEDNEDY